MNQRYKMKNKGTAVVLAILLGGFGVHKFYLGENKIGILYLCFFWTFIPSIIGIIDGILILSLSDENFNRKYNKLMSEIITKTENKNIQSNTVVKSIVTKSESVDEFVYMHPKIQLEGVQLLESFRILSSTINVDTLIGRYDVILDRYLYFIKASTSPRYSTDIQSAIDRFKTVHYEQIPTELDLFLLLKPNLDILTDFFTTSLLNCFDGFLTHQVNQIANLKQDTAKKNRYKKIMTVANLTLRELETRGSKKDKYIVVINKLKTQISELNKNFDFVGNKPKVDTLVSNEILINPEATFLLTLQSDNTEDLKEAVSIIKNEHLWNKLPQLLPLFSRSNIRCCEVDSYISKYKPLYLENFQSELNKSEEYQNASQRDKELIEAELKVAAINQIYERADCNLITLFSNSDIDFEVDNVLVDRYGFDVITKYFSFGNDTDKVFTNLERSYFDDLLKSGLAISGDDLDIDDVLSSQTLKTLNLISEKEEGFFKRKNKAIEYIKSSPILINNIGKFVAKRNLFKLKPLPEEFQILDTKMIVNHWSFLREYIELVINTYRNSESYEQTLLDNDEYVKSYKVSNRAVDDSENSCPRSIIEIGKQYDITKPPVLPFHVGCQCYLNEIY